MHLTISESNNGVGGFNGAQCKLVMSNHGRASTGEFLLCREAKCHKQQLREDCMFQVVGVLIFKFLFEKRIIEM